MSYTTKVAPCTLCVKKIPVNCMEKLFLNIKRKAIVILTGCPMGKSFVLWNRGKTLIEELIPQHI